MAKFIQKTCALNRTRWADTSRLWRAINAKILLSKPSQKGANTATEVSVDLSCAAVYHPRLFKLAGVLSGARVQWRVNTAEPSDDKPTPTICVWLMGGTNLDTRGTASKLRRYSSSSPEGFSEYGKFYTSLPSKRFIQLWHCNISSIILYHNGVVTQVDHEIVCTSTVWLGAKLILMNHFWKAEADSKAI
jgi:hypothetical protein